MNGPKLIKLYLFLKNEKLNRQFEDVNIIG